MQLISAVLVASALFTGPLPQDGDPPAVVSPQTKPLPAAIGTTVQAIDPRIWVMHQARDGAYWLGSNGNGVYRYEGEVLTHFTRADGLAGHQVRDIQEDPEGGILVSTNSGVSRFDGKGFRTLEVVFAPMGSEQWKIEPDDVWVVFEPGERGPCRYDGTRLYELELSGSPVEEEVKRWYVGTKYKATDIYSIHRDQKGHVWFGTAGAGLCRFDGKELCWMYETHLTKTPRGGDFGIRSIFLDRAGALWVCNTRERFEVSPKSTVQDGFRVLEYESKEGVPDAATDDAPDFLYFTSMLEDPEGALWMACTAGMALRYDGKKLERFVLPDEGYVAKILRGHDGTIWVGTIEDGVHVLKDGRFEPFAAGGK